MTKREETLKDIAVNKYFEHCKENGLVPVKPNLVHVGSKYVHLIDGKTSLGKYNFREDCIIIGASLCRQTFAKAPISN